MDRECFVHPSADVSPKAQIGKGTKIWQHCQVREGAVLGRDCILSKGVYIDVDVRVGNNVKIQNGISYLALSAGDGRPDRIIPLAAMSLAKTQRWSWSSRRLSKFTFTLSRGMIEILSEVNLPNLIL